MSAVTLRRDVRNTEPPFLRSLSDDFSSRLGACALCSFARKRCDSEIREKWEKKREKEYEKAQKKARKRHARDDDHDRDR